MIKAQDTISAKLAECFITIKGNRYNFAQATNVEAKVEKEKAEIKSIGNTGTTYKTIGWKGTGSATFRYNTSILRKALEEYKNTGIDMYFDMQITNEDKASALGRQTTILINCNTDGGMLAQFDSEGEVLEEEMDFTFEDFRIPETFNKLPEMFS